MEPVTHVLTGLCLARSGLHRRAAYATVTMAIAAEFPDIDTLWSLRGPVAGFEHHRGITHTFLGIPFEAALLVSCVYLFHRWRSLKSASGKTSSRKSSEKKRAPVRWGSLFCFALVALLSHILLDYTNNYGVRPFLPFNDHWYAGSIVFIFDPLLFVLLLAGLLLPSLFGLIGQEIAGKHERFRGAAWPRSALLLILAYWGLRGYEHHKALQLGQGQTMRAPVTLSAQLAASAQDGTSSAEQTRPLLMPRNSLASPDPFSPFRWYLATDYGPAYQLATADTRQNSLTPDRILNKPDASPALSAARQSRLGRVYLDWSPMPWISVDNQQLSNAATRPGQTTVSFQDVRFMGSLALLQRRETPPLTAEIDLDASGKVVAQGIDGRVEQ